jgi:hypothetical protein
MGPNGIPRSTCCFRHTYATCRLSEGVDVYIYILSERMGTSVKMIENHYGHVNTIKHADRVLMGIGGWEAMHADMDAEGDVEEATAKARQAAKSKQSVRPAHFKRRLRIADALSSHAFAPVFRCAAGAHDRGTGQAGEGNRCAEPQAPLCPRLPRTCRPIAAC